ncbi:MAG: hypothetical protein ISP89_02655 [Pseudomonadales bacterium]|nr:hypothetical protein [Pseudomonadales bacterium]
MFAVDIRLSPLIPLSVWITHAVFFYAAIDLPQAPALKAIIALGIFISLIDSLRRCSTRYPKRIRRLIITGTKSLLITQQAGGGRNGVEDILEREVPTLVRCGEFLVFLRFNSIEKNRRPIILRLWPGSLSRRDASLLRRYLNFSS